MIKALANRLLLRTLLVVAAVAPAPAFAKRATCESAFSQKAETPSNDGPKLLTDQRPQQKLLTHLLPKPKPTKVDRKPYFETAYDRLGRVLKFAEENVKNLTWDEQKMLKELSEFMASNTQVYDNGTVRFTAYLWYLETQGNFILDEDQPVRTASTRSHGINPFGCTRSDRDQLAAHFKA